MEKLILLCFLSLLVGKVATTGRDLGHSCSRSTDPCVHPYHKLVCDRLASKCVLAEGELCGPHGTEGLCVSGAHCQVLGDDTTQCRCGTAGYTASGGYCDIETNKYGGSCSNGNCFHSTLTCLNTTDTGLCCDCVKGRNPDIFVTGTCHEELVFVGALCNSAEDCSQTHFDAYRCVSHRCQCAPGYNGLDGEECEEIVDVAVGKACDVNTGQGCGEQRATHLECSPQDGVCTCVHGYVGLTGNQCYPAAGRLHGGCNASTSGVQGTCLHDRHVCIHDHTDGPMYCQDLCQLPSDTGLCKAYLPRFFYNWATGECQQFVYGGCGGNANRFETKENCQATCSKDYICQLPSETGPCEAYFPSFYYNSETGTCQQFIYGGCGGNANRFETKGECHAACSKDVCQQPNDSGMCVAYFPRYFYNLTSGACEEFIYGGCGANDNNFGNKTQCEKACVKDACEQPKQPGMCHGYFPRYFYNPTSGTCEVFIYGGCGGNDNNFDNETQCEKTCLKDVCQQPKETGRCQGYFPRYFYNPTSGTCEDFVYGGCGGNDNNFDNKTQCDEACVKDVCQKPKETGMCRGYFPRYFYNPTSGACENFIYGGCGGNENNFENKTKCEKTCLEDIDVCDQPKETGMCRGYFPRHFYNPTSGTCEDFVYGGCGGNGNNFENKTQCEKACVKDVCQQPKETGMCQGYFPRYFYNPSSGTCQDFVYGGCGGNKNNFQNKTQCEKACVKDVCQQPKETGMCRGYFPRYFYNPTSGTCENFVYGGCGGNGNNFDNKTQCEKTCLKDVCHQPRQPGMCRGYFPRYFYNPTSGTCENFVYGGCGGNENNFESLKDCKHACMNEVVCQQPQRAGRCQAYFTKYFYNTQTDACEDFVYGGCDGNDNNFETKVQCQDTCVKETGGSRRLQSWIVITVLAVLTEWCFIHL